MTFLFPRKIQYVCFIWQGSLSALYETSLNMK